MKKSLVVLGDPLSSGGSVVTTAQTIIKANGIPVASIGDSTFCPIPLHWSGTIVEGHIPTTIFGKPIAYDGCKASCGCTLVAKHVLNKLFVGTASEEKNIVKSKNQVNEMINEKRLQKNNKTKVKDTNEYLTKIIIKNDNTNYKNKNNNESNIKKDIQIKNSENSDKKLITDEKLDDDYKIFVATIYGESANSSVIAWKCIAWTIMNRVKYGEWNKMNSPVEVIKKTGYDAYTDRANHLPYKNAKKMLDDNTYKNNMKLNELHNAVLPIYKKIESDFTGGALSYFSPKAQLSLNKKYPSKYPNKVPKFATSNQFEELKIEGLQKSDDFIFYKYSEYGVSIRKKFCNR